MQITGAEVVSIITAVVAAGGAITSALIAARKKSKEEVKSGELGASGNLAMVSQASIQAVNATGSNVAVGGNITQTFQGDLHNHISAVPPAAGPFDGKLASSPAFRTYVQQ